MVPQCIAGTGNECITEETCDQQVNKNFYTMLSPNLHNLEKIIFVGKITEKDLHSTVLKKKQRQNMNNISAHRVLMYIQAHKYQ